MPSDSVIIQDKNTVDEFFDSQLRDWPLARENFAALKNVKSREIKVDNARFFLQFNPERIRSTAAKTDTISLSHRKCFLCEDNFPPEQQSLSWNNRYNILVNPFPIFPRHLVIASKQHTPQSVDGRIGDFMELAAELTDFELFYNGPHCGASAPDHAHFQAGTRGFMPFLCDLSQATFNRILNTGASKMSVINGLGRTAFIIKASTIESGKEMFCKLYDCLPQEEKDQEPMINLLASYSRKDQWTLSVFPRRKHRPDCYFSQGDDNILISPASVDMGGVFILPLEKDFNKMTDKDIKSILNEVCITPEMTENIIRQLQ